MFVILIVKICNFAFLICLLMCVANSTIDISLQSSFLSRFLYKFYTHVSIKSIYSRVCFELYLASFIFIYKSLKITLYAINFGAT